VEWRFNSSRIMGHLFMWDKLNTSWVEWEYMNAALYSFPLIPTYLIFHTRMTIPILS
jgi:hypothetical protein